MIYGLLFSGAVRAAIVLALGLGIVALLSRAAAATRRFVLVLTFGAAIVVPVAAATSPRWKVEAPAAFAILAHESDKEGLPGDAIVARQGTRVQTAGVASLGAGSVDPKEALLVVWLMIAAAILARAVASQLRARGLARRATHVERGPWISAAELVEGGTELAVEIRASSEVDSPAVMGLFRGTIVVPHDALDWPLERCQLVLAHELAHVRRRDVLAQALADVACALHWCNPLVWICARRLRVEREIAADDAVLAAGVRPSLYAESLVAIATSVATPSAALAIAERSSLEPRITSILAARIARAPLAARGTAAVIAASAALAAVAACTSPEVARQVPTAPPATVAAVPPGANASFQHAADDELAAITKEWSPELATIVVLDPATGEILANAGPSNVAIAPGSTLKPITIAAALERHAITVDQKFDCGPAPRMYGTRAFHDASPNGTLDLAHLLAVSSNIGMTRIFDALGGDNFTQWLHRFHFGAVPDVATGSFEGASAAIGQHSVTATPLQMIAAYGALANDGVYHAPTFDRGGSASEQLLTPETAHAVMALLETAVVDPTATGKAARVDGVHVAGKTGTAEWTAPDGRSRTYASFIGIADLPSRRVVALVGIQAARDDLYGGASAAPAFARLVKRIGGS